MKRQRTIGWSLLLLGLLICCSVVIGIQSCQGDTRIAVNSIPNPFNIFTPSQYSVLNIPDFFLYYLAIGVSLSTIGIMMVIYSSEVSDSRAHHN